MTSISTYGAGLLRIVCAAVALTSAASAAQAAEITLKAGTSWNDKFPMAYMLNEFIKPRLEEYTNGRLTIDVHLAKSLCSEKTCVEQVKLGQTDIGTASIANYGGFSKTFEILTLPYIFKDNESAKQVMSGFLVEELRRQAVDVDRLKIIAIVPLLGFRHLQTNVGIIRTPGDLKGVKIRVTKSPLDGALLRAWGAVATPVDWAETYDAVQQKVVRGLYIQKAVHTMMKFNEVSPFVTLTGGAFTPMIIFMDRSRYEGLPAWARTAIDRASDELQAEAFDIDDRYSERLGSKVQGKVEYYSPTPEEMAQWRRASVDAWVLGKRLGLYDAALARRVLESQDGMDEFIAELDRVGAL